MQPLAIFLLLLSIRSEQLDAASGYLLVVAADSVCEIGCAKSYVGLRNVSSRVLPHFWERAMLIWCMPKVRFLFPLVVSERL